MRFVFETKDDLISTTDSLRIKAIDDMVEDSPDGNTTSLSDLFAVLNPLVNSFGDVKVSLEPIDF
jgi:hypothetical protein